jgi:glycosyltransferase involved in cell wall biosynthesis
MSPRHAIARSLRWAVRRERSTVTVKVCFVTTSFVRSASDHYARFVYEQAKSVREAEPGVSVVVVAPHAPGLADRETIDGLEIHRVRYFWPARLQRLAYRHEGLFETLRGSRLAWIQLPCLLIALMLGLFRGARGATVIHAQWVPTAAIALIVGMLRGISVVVSVRGADMNSARKSRFGRWLTRAIINRVSHVVTVSDEFRDLLLSDLGCRKPVVAIYNGVDTSQFHPRDRSVCRRELGLPPEAPVVLYVGSLIERKGVACLIAALARGVAEPVGAYIVGEGPQRASLEELAERGDTRGRVHFLGGVAKDRVHLWMGAADMLVLPSYSEGRPNVVLEALASGTPVVASAVNGTTELIRDGEDGLLFRPGDVVGLHTCIVHLLAESELATMLAARGPQRVASLGLSWPDHGRRLLAIYRETVGN